MAYENEEYIRYKINSSVAEANKLTEIYFERNQLYGCLIKMLNDAGITQVNVTRENFLEVSKYELIMTPSEDHQSVTLEIRPLKVKEEIKKEDVSIQS